MQTLGQESNANDMLYSGGREPPIISRHALLRSFSFLLEVPNGLAFHILEKVTLLLFLAM